MQTPFSSTLAPAKSKGSTRSRFLKWLRRIHGWIGLWGAIAGLLFGVTGILQNHRAVMRLPMQPPKRSTVQLDVPEVARVSPQALGAYLRQSLDLSHAPERLSKDRAQPVTWGDKTVQQPERWEIRFAAPNYMVSAEYWRGAAQVSVTRIQHNLFGIIQNLHRSNGVAVPWILLADSFAGAMVMLSITGVILWSELNKRRLVGFSIFAASTIAIIASAAASF